MEQTELAADELAAIRARHEVPGVFRLPKREDGLGVQGHRVLMEFEGDLWVVLDANTHHPSVGKITAAAAASFADIPALLSHAAALQAKVARLEGERDAKQRIVDSWEDGREWWECTKCGDRFHGISEEAPFHDGDRRSDPYCNTCGEGGQ